MSGSTITPHASSPLSFLAFDFGTQRVVLPPAIRSPAMPSR